MCGEDGTQRVVYKLKEEHARKRGEQKKKERKHRQKKREKREKELYRLPKKTIVVPALGLQYM